MPEIHVVKPLYCEKCGQEGYAKADSAGPFHTSEGFYMRSTVVTERVQIICCKCQTQHAGLRL